MTLCCSGLGHGFPSQNGRRSRRHSLKSQQSLVLNGPERPIEEFYDLGASSLSEGAFGSVRKATCKQSGAVVIVKSMFNYDPQSFALEVDLQAEIDHPNVARIHEAFENAKKQQAFIVLQSCTGGEVLDLLDGSEHKGELDAWVVFKQMMMGVHYMHGVNIAHRDLKPRNLLMQERDLPLADNNVKIIDFGFAQRFKPGKDSLKTKCGSPDYTAPEILQRPYYNEKCDIWSCGVILHLLLTQTLPFEAVETQEVLELAAKGKLNFDGPEWKGISKTAILLVVQMIHLDTSKRITGAMALKSPWCSMHEKDVAKSGVRVVGENMKYNFTRFRGASAFMKATLRLIARHLDDVSTKRLRDTFYALDTDMDGSVTAAELMSKVDDLGIDKVTLEQMVAELDVNHEGGINYSEFMAMHLRTADQLQQGAIWEAFQYFDRNGDGSISASELQEALHASGDGEDPQAESAQAVAAMLQEADSDGDGLISFEEFEAMVKNYAKSVHGLRRDSSPGP